MPTEDEIARAIAENILASSKLTEKEKGAVLAHIAALTASAASPASTPASAAESASYDDLDPVAQFAYSFTHENNPPAIPGKITR